MPSYVVAGASRGLGLEFVVQLSKKADNTVFALARNPDNSKGLQDLKKLPNVHLVKADITNAPALRAAAETVAKATGGSLDVLINNAAIMNPLTNFIHLDEYESDQALIDDFHNNFDTNLLGPVLTTNIFLPLILKGKLKKVLTISTGVSDPEFINKAQWWWAPAYCITKAGLQMSTVKYAIKYKKEGVIFLNVSPGVVNTAEAPPPAEFIPKIQEMAGAFAKIAPHWKGPIETPDSVEAVLGVLDRATIDDSGSFVSHHGNKEWL